MFKIKYIHLLKEYQMRFFIYIFKFTFNFVVSMNVNTVIDIVHFKLLLTLG